MPNKSKPTFATYVGLFCALGLPLLIFPFGFLMRKQLHVHVSLWQAEAVVWGLAALVLCILVFWERLPLAAIGLRRPTWKSLLWGFIGAIAVRIFAAAVLVVYAALSGVSMTQAFAHDVSIATKLGALPYGVILLLALRAGVTEEILFRGYGIGRLAAVTGNRAVAAALSLAIFTLAHLGAWDVNYLVVVLPAGLVLTLLYLWRRDLWANMCAHFLTDAVGLSMAYAIAHHLLHLSG